MVISQSSWHYRLLKTVFDSWSIPNSLCPYVRKLLLAIIIIIVVAAGLGFLIASLCTAPLWWFGIINPIRPEWLHLMSVLGTAIWISSAIAAAVRGLFHLLDRRSSTKAKEAGIFGSWVRAKKSKICPYIEFKE